MLKLFLLKFQREISVHKSMVFFLKKIFGLHQQK